MAACVCLCLLAGACAAAEEAALWDDTRSREVETLPLTAALDGGMARVSAVSIDGEAWLFLPAFADPERMTLTLEGESASWAADTEEDGVWEGDVLTDGEASMRLKVMRSQNLRAVFLTSDDPVGAGRAYVEDMEAGKHANRATGEIAVINAAGRVDYAGRLRQLRGRGNYSWLLEKKSYQIKLEEKADLLLTRDRSERNRTWVLLADQSDGTMLSNRIALDLAQEMGMKNTSRCEPVDLYYDGEYRGLYLLAEKVEVGEGRLDVGDYEAMVEAWNRRAGQKDLDALEVGRAENRFGFEFTYIKDLVESDNPADGTFVVEMENEDNTLSDRCWFRMDDSPVMALKSPENASEAMVRYVSERLTEARQTLRSGGVNPETGRTLEDDFDVEAFARLILLNELTYNTDAYSYSSSWFILPAGESRFEPGTAWDFDLAFRYKRDGFNASARGAKDQQGWAADFYNCPAFMKTVCRLFSEEAEPLVTEILLGEREGRFLKPLEQYIAQIEASCRMNFIRWEVAPFRSYLYGQTVEEEWARLRRFLSERIAWLREAFADASDGADTITLWGRSNYVHLDGRVNIYACPWNHVNIRSYTWEKVSDATEESYAQWRLEAVIEPKAGYTFQNPRVTFAGTELSWQRLEDGALRIAFFFDDPSYRPADYYGDDMGLVYNEDFYRQRYPDISAEYGDDSEGLLEYFCDEGMYEGQMGNAFFWPSEILFCNPELKNILGMDWQLYYSEYLSYGVEDGWVLRTGRSFGLEARDALEEEP